MKNRSQKQPQLFKKCVYNVAGLDKYARQRVRAVQAEVHRLQESEFPYEDSEKALEVLQTRFGSLLEQMQTLRPDNDPAVVARRCAESLRILYQYLPLLGFILRSTNTRNAFEQYYPLLRLAGDLLEPGVEPRKRRTRLVLSSEWEYSPLVYSEIPDLRGFMLLGFPATESGNMLLAPLAGHKLGHSLWSM